MYGGGGLALALVSRGGGWLFGRCLFIVRGLYGVTGFRQHNQLTPPAGKESTNRPTGRFSPSTTAVGRDEIRAACPNVVLVVGNFASRHNLFVQDTIGYPLLLGQPWRARLRYASLWRSDGTEVGQVISPDGEKVIRFMVVQANDQRHRRSLNHRATSHTPEDFERYLRDEGGVSVVPAAPVEQESETQVDVDQEDFADGRV